MRTKECPRRKEKLKNERNRQSTSRGFHLEVKVRMDFRRTLKIPKSSGMPGKRGLRKGH